MKIYRTITSLIKPWYLSAYANILFMIVFWNYFHQQSIDNQGIIAGDIFYFICSLLASFYAYQIVYYYCKKKLSTRWTIALSLIQSVTFIISFTLFYYFNSFLNLGLLSFLYDHAWLSLHIVTSRLSWLNLAMVTAVLALFFYAWGHHDPKWLGRFAARKKIILTLFITFTMVCILRPNTQWNSIENHYFSGIYHGIKMIFTGGYPYPSQSLYLNTNRMALPELKNPDPNVKQPNVLIFRLEEVARNRFGLYFPEYQTTPLLHAFAQANPAEFFLYQNHFTHATATDTSVNIIYTGLNPTRSGHDFMHYPLMWDYAKAAGYHTFATLAYDITFGNLDKKFKSANGNILLDYLISADNADIDLDYDDGISDEVVNQYALEHLHKIAAAKQPFFGIISYYATHDDGHGVSVFGRKALGNNEMTRPMTNYQFSIYYIDHKISEIIAALKELDLLENTIIVWTSDHGTDIARLDPKLTSRRRRLISYYQEVLSIPFFIYIPQQLQHNLDDIYPDWRGNVNKVTSNVDILPTVIDFLGLGDIPNIQQITSELDGKSLVRQLPEHRWLEIKSTNDLRHWEPDGFSLVYYPYKYIINDGKQAIFDLKNDPGELNNLFPTKGGDTKAFWGSVENYIADNEQLTELYQKYNHHFHTIIQASTLHTRSGITMGNALVSTEKGMLSYGPYLYLRPGKYRFELEYTTPTAPIGKMKSHWEIGYFTEGDPVVLDDGSFEPGKNNAKVISEVQITADFQQRPVEMRTFYEGNGSMFLYSLEVQQVK